jgi:hypothetical protein
MDNINESETAVVVIRHPLSSVLRPGAVAVFAGSDNSDNLKRAKQWIADQNGDVADYRITVVQSL